MEIAGKEHNKSQKRRSSAIAGTFEVSVEEGRIVLQPLVDDILSVDDILVAGAEPGEKSGDGLVVSAEIIAQAKSGKVVVFKKRRRHNYRRKKGPRQQHTILRIVAIPQKERATAAEGDPEVARAKGEGRKRPSVRRSNSAAEKADLTALARDLDAAADRMGASLDRAIEAARTALDPEREITARKRYEAELTGIGKALRPGFA